ncbi:hypothetical protein [Candidatus Pelagibacter communis]|uniref:hypothetical protein n=1 Tax=Candidatus Pelagibacter TaxID=198251 RepID=UPI003EDFCDB1
MKIFDCFMYFDEEIILDLRLNLLNEYVDYFVIVESTFNHKGEKRSLNFNIKKFKKFENKIIYLIYDKEPNGIEILNDKDSDDEKYKKYVLNAVKRENSQRNFILKGLSKADGNDFILISDVDEIPSLANYDFKKNNRKIIFFKQDMFYYKFNLKLPNLKWIGTRGCKRKDLISPQWLRNIKDKKYSFLRLDVLFSKKKYINMKIVENGGWHFTNIKSPKALEHKLKSYLHHRDFDLNPLSLREIKEIMNKKKAIYNLNVDKKKQKIGNGDRLEKVSIESLPNYIKKNLQKYSEWID